MKKADYRCVAVAQPWAWAICAGQKTIENRSWSTSHRGRIVIVSTAKSDVLKALRKANPALPRIEDRFPTGAAIGVVDVVNIQPLNQSLESNPWAFGPQCWSLANAKLFAEPIPCKGKLNLYPADEDLAVQIEKQLQSAKAVKADADAMRWVEAMCDMPNDDRVDSWIANYESLGDFESMLRLITPALANTPEDWFLNEGRARANYELGHNEEALVALNILIAQEPKIAALYANRAEVNERLGNAKQAAADRALAEKYKAAEPQ